MTVEYPETTLRNSGSEAFYVFYLPYSTKRTKEADDLDG